MTTTLQGALRPDADRVAVRFERRYPATATEVWSAVTDPERISRWLAPTTLLEDGRYRIDFSDGYATVGEVVECDPPRSLVVTWDFPDEPTSRVAVEVLPDGDGSLLVLDHTRLPLNQGAGYGAGWEAHLAGLEAQLAGQIPPDWDERFGALLPAYLSALGSLQHAAQSDPSIRAGSGSASAR
jgi:uncharacterized protein YndB with AHSA1/START domain